MTRRNSQKIKNVIKLSIPAILTQIATIVMQYIDSAMVARIGDNASASIGLVSTSTWLFGGLLTALAVGFSVQIAQLFGAKEHREARIVLRHGLIFSMMFALTLMLIGILISSPLPKILRANQNIWNDSTLYFLIFSLSLPFMMISSLCGSSLQCSGNMVAPSILNAVMCLMDVLFNIIFIPKYGVMGASIGTALSVVVTSLIMFIICCFIDKNLRITIKDNTKYNYFIIKKAIKICMPIALEQAARSGAMIVSTGIVAPLGDVALAANSFAVTVESVCYMPGYGVQAAATTLVGQEMGAGDYKKAKSYGNISIVLGTVIMSFMAIVLYFTCPLIFKVLTPSSEVQVLAATVLRIGCFAEPLYAVSIVAAGALRGAEDTFIPSISNLLSIWIVRITLSIILVVPLGLIGVWLANTIELCVRGILLLIRQITTKYYDRNKIIID